MSRFQAQTDAVLDEELDDLRERLGLRANQKADLLRELAAFAGWVVRQAEAGKRIEARSGTEVERLDHPALERVRARRGRGPIARIVLTESEVDRLAGILDRGFAPTPALRKVLADLAAGDRRPPRTKWKDRAK